MGRRARSFVLPWLAALTACACTGEWSLDEPTQAVFTEFSQRDAKVALAYSCDLPPTALALLDQAVLILDDYARFVVDRHRRWQQAMTEAERGELATLRDAVVERLYSHVDQLRAVADQAEEPTPTARLGIVYDTGPVADVGSRSATGRFQYVGVFRPDEHPTGVVVRQVSPTQAVAAVLDEMRSFARDEGILTTETKEQLTDW